MTKLTLLAHGCSYENHGWEELTLRHAGQNLDILEDLFDRPFADFLRRAD
jgi:hypothetical protein